MEQRTKEWYQARMGIFTSSRLCELLVEPKKKGIGEFGDTAWKYIYEVASEKSIKKEFLNGEGWEMYQNRIQLNGKAIQWGTEMEELARDEYSVKTGYNVKEVGMITNDNISCFGDSPDGIVMLDDGSIGTIEIKCPSLSTHQLYIHKLKEPKDLLSVEKKYYVQCQCHILANNAKWCDFISYDPMQVHDMHILRILPDEEMLNIIIDKIAAAELELTNLCRICYSTHPTHLNEKNQKHISKRCSKELVLLR